MSIAEEIAAKEERVRAYMRRHKLACVLLSRQDNFAWFTCGGDNHVAISTEMGVATILITARKKYIIASNIEALRIEREEVAGQGYEFITYPWYDEGRRVQLIQKLVRGRLAQSDDGSAGTARLLPEFVELRYSLTPEELVRYRKLGRDCGEAIGEAARAVQPGETEARVAGNLMRECAARNIVPVVVLVAADERIERYRHPIFTEKPIGKAAMLVLCGRRHGLICSVTRLVHFGPLEDVLAAKHEAVTQVDAAFILQTVPGRRVGDIFAEVVEIYREAGFPDEWKLHHQGGATGYATRDYKAIPGDQRCVQLNQAFAWNPSITGTKSEDTIIAAESGPEVITATPSWPMLQAEWRGLMIARPAILVR